ncbi:ATP-binding protein [Bradyrhizobium sp. sBnM-33]|uniref:ATP-binding protein n=1 Tax=Bradyrhizobium sp. sBnM-33 TaxID=2831780 RepID=UPI001BCD422D|nr:ATP-binding protein [Bradyrhizobium sp. sBnM-33]WOH53592.1 ATP-binding protein [Bradyrhizobium sp. sBnM-33]
MGRQTARARFGYPPAQGVPSSSAFVGRETERALIDQIVAMRADRPDVVLVTGEPGIGKSRILAHIGERFTSAGGRAFVARAYEAEAARPYGVWIDVIREILRESRHDGLPADLGLLLPETGTVAEAGNRTRLLDAVVGLLRDVVSGTTGGHLTRHLQ